MKFPSMNRKFGNKMYVIVHVYFASLSYGEKNAKNSAEKYVQKLRDAGFSSRVQREKIIRYPKIGPEVVFNVCARKDAMTLEKVNYEAKKVLGTLPYGYGEKRS